MAKVTGAARYPYEEPVANVAYGVIVTSTIAAGRVTSIDGAILELTTATGKSVRVDTTLATKASQNVGLKIGLAADVRGDERAGTLFATAVLHAKPQPALWGTNR